MAKGMYKKWLESENLLLLQGWKYKGLTDEQIAHNIGVAPRTLERWKNNYSQICRALKRGKDHANFAVENALLKKALSGNTTAMIFWLKNNYREKYSDTQRSPIEEQLTKEQIRKANAEAKIAEVKAKDMVKSDDSQMKAIGGLLDKIETEVQEDDTTK
ncbi:small terminase subunit [Companilactobacillus zhachilii]|uniref:small terminase subunit n=1 Tax=Companilactobacillus zhachilii TaxID=2304606 RepID=UPI0040333293